MGRVYKRGERWCIDYTGLDGERQRKVILGGNRMLAKEALAKMEAEVAERKYFPGRVGNTRPFSFLIDLYARLHGNKIAKVWRHMIANDLRPALGDKRTSSIRASDLQVYYNKIAERASAPTANRHMALIRSIFNKAKKWGEFYGENPCSGVAQGRENVHRLRYLDKEEMERLLAAVHPRVYPVVACALLTGMRRAEILSLDWRNVNLDRGIIYLLKTKSGKLREVTVTTKLSEVLRALGPKEAGSVFNMPNMTLRRYFEKAMTEAKITGFRFHDLRHTFASHFIMRTNDLPALQNMLGHSTPTMTLRYAHLSRPHLISELAIFEGAIPIGEALRKPPGALSDRDIVVKCSEANAALDASPCSS